MRIGYNFLGKLFTLFVFESKVVKHYEILNCSSYINVRL